MNKATEVMMQYVENLKRTYEKDHAELMEFKKLANQNSNRCYSGSVDTGGSSDRMRLWPESAKQLASACTVLAFSLREESSTVCEGCGSSRCVVCLIKMREFHGRLDPCL